jgi:TolA-binding protein
MKQHSDAKEIYTKVMTQYPGTAAAAPAEQKRASLMQ